MLAVFSNTRPASYVPVFIRVLLFATIIFQCVWHYYFAEIRSEKSSLPEPQQAVNYQLVSLNDSVTMAKLLMLWLQAFDNQPGISLALRELDYDKLSSWLNLILKLDQHIQYPLLAAIRFYAEVPDEVRQRKMIEFVKQSFLQRPNHRWSAMAHAVYVAKHRIKDLELAVESARLLRLHATGDKVPYWAKQMEFFVLEDMGELEAAMILIGGLLESGELDDEHQQEFLSNRLEEIKQRQQQTN